MKRTERDIDLLFFTYKSYYNENNDYIVHWEINWWWLFIIGGVIAGLVGLGG